MKTDHLALEEMTKKQNDFRTIHKICFVEKFNRYAINTYANSCIDILRKVVDDKSLHLLLDRGLYVSIGGCMFQPFKIRVSHIF